MSSLQIAATPVWLTCRQLRKVVSADFTLKVDHWRIAQGAITVLLGPTGSGKSTLLEMLAGTLTADQGEWTDSAGLAYSPTTLDSRRSVSWVPQQPQLLAGTVKQNVEIGLRLRGDRRQEPVEQSLANWQLRPLANRNVAKLSGGQMQGVALARATAFAPKVLLLDEPTSGLDPQRVAQVEANIRAAVSQQGITVVWTTHHLHQAARVADEAAFMHDGELIEAGSADQLLRHPIRKELQQFLNGEL